MILLDKLIHSFYKLHNDSILYLIYFAFFYINPIFIFIISIIHFKIYRESFNPFKIKRLNKTIFKFNKKYQDNIFMFIIQIKAINDANDYSLITSFIQINKIFQISYHQDMFPHLCHEEFHNRFLLYKLHHWQSVVDHILMFQSKKML